MAMVKLGIWNIEWMNDLFRGDPPVIKPLEEVIRGPGRDNTVGERINDISSVIGEIDVDVLVIVEGPNRVDELQLFFDEKVDGSWRCAVQPSGAQSVGMAVRVDRGHFLDEPFIQFDTKSAAEAPFLAPATDPFQMDTDSDGVDEIHKFERKPLYAELKLADDTVFRVVGIHLKSKGVFDSLEWSKWWAMAEGNRKKLLAQCFRLRNEFLDSYLAQDATQNIPLIICGDINDGPGFDTSEMRLQASGVETLMGSVWNAEFCLGNVMFDTLSPKEKANLNFEKLVSASFKDPIFDGTYQRVWIDHILYTKVKKNWARDGKIHEDMAGDMKIYRKYPTASDHYPVTCTVITN